MEGWQISLKEQAYYCGGGDCSAEQVEYRIFAAHRGMNNRIARRKQRRLAHV
jgi:hypothetical protein